MKKLTALLLALATTFTLTACDNIDTEKKLEDKVKSFESKYQQQASSMNNQISILEKQIEEALTTTTPITTVSTTTTVPTTTAAPKIILTTPKPKNIIPDFVGMTEKEAISACNKANLLYEIRYEMSNKNIGIVYGQSISANTEYSKGTKIELWVTIKYISFSTQTTAKMQNNN